MASFFATADVPKFEMQSCGRPSDWSRNESSGFWNNKVKRWFQRLGKQPAWPHIGKFLQFLAIRPDAEGKPISEKLGPATFENNEWFRFQWLEFTAEADADLAANGWERAWHGSKLEALYSIMYQGHLVQGERHLADKPGVYVHKDSTRDKAENYIRFVPLMCDGVFWAVKWEVRANRQDFVPNPGSDQWVQPARSIQLAALWVCGRNAAQMQNGHAVSWEWKPLKEANPFLEEPETSLSRRSHTPPWRSDAAKKSSSAAKSAPPVTSSSVAKPAPPDYQPPLPLADALFKALGERMDASETDRRVLAELAKQLWTGGLTMPPSESTVPNPKTSGKAKARLEYLLQKAKSVREHYQNRALTLGTMITDIDFQRSLDAAETMLVQNLYMNDVAEWMEPDDLQKCEFLIRKAEALDNAIDKRGRSTTAKSKGTDVNKGSAAKPVLVPRQRAQQMKKQRFDEMISNFAVTKAFFMALVRHPRLMTADGIMSLMEEVREVKASKEYQERLHVAAKKQRVE